MGGKRLGRTMLFVSRSAIPSRPLCVQRIQRPKTAPRPAAQAAEEGPRRSPRRRPRRRGVRPQRRPRRPLAPLCMWPTCTPSPPTAAPAEQAITWADLQEAVKRRSTQTAQGAVNDPRRRQVLRAARELETEFVNEQRKLAYEAHHLASFKWKSPSVSASQLDGFTRQGFDPEVQKQKR